MKFKLSINTNIVNKGNPAANGWRNCEMNAIELLTHICNGFAYSPAVLIDGHNGNKPANKDAVEAQILSVDIDNAFSKNERKSEEQGYYSFAEALIDPFLNQFALAVYTTPSHTQEWNRFRIIFLLPFAIKDATQYKLTTSAFIEKYEADAACKDISRLFFGSTNCEYKIFGNKLNQTELNRITKAPNEIINETNAYNATGFNGDLTAAQVSYILGHIPAHIDYTDWFKCVSAVGNYFDESTAISIIENWSPDTTVGTAYRIKHRAKNVHIGTIIYFAKHYGNFDSKKFYKDLFNERKKANALLVKPDKKVSQKLAQNAIQENDEQPAINDVYFDNNTNSIVAIENYLNDNFNFRYNVITAKTEFKGIDEKEYSIFSDKNLNEIWRNLKKLGMKGGIESIQNVINSDYPKEFNPFKSYFNSLPEWDGNDYIKQASDLVQVIPEQTLDWELYLRRWLIATAGCALERTINHTCIVLAGEQGIGKTTFWKRLIPDELIPYYNINQISPNSKDDKILLSENFIINLDEMESASRDEIGHLKSLLTIDKINVRRPYARYVEILRRRASFVGSVNKAMFLTDMTGNRRFLVVEALKIDYSKIDFVNQLWAQVLELLNDGEKHWFDGDEITKINETNEKYAVQSIEEEMILKYYEKVGEHESLTQWNCYATSDIFNELSKHTTAKLNIRTLGMALKKLGFVRKNIKIDNKPRYKWLAHLRNDDGTLGSSEPSAF